MQLRAYLNLPNGFPAGRLMTAKTLVHGANRILDRRVRGVVLHTDLKHSDDGEAPVERRGIESKLPR